MNRREMKILLEERFERIALLETRIDTMEQLVDGYREREQSIIDTLREAKSTAAHTLDDARTEAEGIREQVQKETESLLGEAKSTAASLSSAAEREAEELRRETREKSDRMLRDAEIIKKEYEELASLFNSILDKNAKEMHQTAERFANFMEGSKIELLDVKLDKNEFYQAFESGALPDNGELPDPEGDPAALMRNIYHLQNRSMPGSESEAAAEASAPGAAVPAAEEAAPAQPAEQETESGGDVAIMAAASPEAPAEETEAAAEPVDAPADEAAALEEAPAAEPEAAEAEPAHEPYSEKAWANEQAQSRSEPQAEFTPAFDGAYQQSDYTVQPNECAVPTADAEHVFDDYFTENSIESMTYGAGTAAPAAWDTAEQGENGFSAEAGNAFDQFFSEGMTPGAASAPAEPIAEPVQEAEPDVTAEPETAAAEPVREAEPEETAADEAPYTYEGVRVEEAHAEEPAPYSEQAWTHESFTSDFEPQAEAAPAFDAAGVSGEQTPQAETGEGAQAEQPDSAYEAYAEQGAAMFDSMFSGGAQAAGPQSVVNDENIQAAEAPAAEAQAYSEEGASAFDSMFGESTQAGEPQSVVNDENIQAAEAPQAEPQAYSETAWADGSFTGDAEPKAEAESAFDSMFSGEQAPESGDSFGAETEPREWEPEREPDMDGVPTVSQVMPGMGSGDDVSLDQLLDEIIKAGE